MASCIIEKSKLAKSVLEDTVEFYGAKIGASKLGWQLNRMILLGQDMKNYLSEQGQKAYNALFGINTEQNRIYSKWSDSLKTYQGMSAKDREAVDNILREGDRRSKVFSSEELAGRGLSQDQIKAYRETRKVFDSIYIDNVMSTAHATDNKALYKAAQIFAQYRNKAKLGEIVEPFKTETGELINLKNVKNKKEDNFSRLTQSEQERYLDFMAVKKAYKDIKAGYREGYINRERIGDYYIKFVDSNGDTVYHQRFDAKTPTERNAILEQARKQVIEDRNLIAKERQADELAILKARREKHIGNPAKLQEIDNQIANVSSDKWLEANYGTKIEEITGRADDREYISELQAQKDRDVTATLNFMRESMKNGKGNLSAEVQTAMLDAFNKMADDATKLMMAKGFKAHKISRAKDTITGYRTDDLLDSMNNYMHQASASIARVNGVFEFHKAYDGLSGKDRIITQKAFENFIRPASSIDNISSKISTVQHAVAFMGKISNYFINRYAGIPQGVGVLIDRLGVDNTTAWKTYGKAVKDTEGLAWAYMKEVAKTAKTGKIPKMSEFLDGYNAEWLTPELKKDLKAGIAEGITFEQMATDLAQASTKRSKLGTAFDYAMLPTAFSEQMSRIQAFVAGHRLMTTEKMNKLYDSNFVSERLARDAEGNLVTQGRNKADAITMLSDEINGMYSKANWSGLKGDKNIGAVTRALFPLQTYASHALAMNVRYAMTALKYWDTLIGRKLTPEEAFEAKQALSAFVSQSAGIGILGGAVAFPAIALANAIDEKLSDDGIGFIEEWKAEGNPLAYGIAGKLGVDVTGSLQAQVPYLSGSYLFSRAGQAGKDASFMRTAYEIVAPETVKNIVKAITDEDIKSKATGEPIKVNGNEIARSGLEDAMKVMGFQSATISQAKSQVRIKKLLDTYLNEQKKQLNADFRSGELEQEDMEEYNNNVNILNQYYGINAKPYTPRMGKGMDYVIGRYAE